MIVSNDYSGLSKTENFISNHRFLNESDCEYTPNMVPIMEYYDNQYIINMNDLLEYSFNNGIDDGVYAISSICECNNIDMNDIIIKLNEQDQYDDEIMSTAKIIGQAGFKIMKSSS